MPTVWDHKTFWSWRLLRRGRNIMLEFKDFKITTGFLVTLCIIVVFIIAVLTGSMEASEILKIFVARMLK